MHSSDSESVVPDSDTGWEWFTTHDWDWWEKQRTFQGATTPESAFTTNHDHDHSHAEMATETDLNPGSLYISPNPIQALSLSDKDSEEESTEIEDVDNSRGESTNTSASSFGDVESVKRTIVDLSHAVHVDGDTTVYEDAVVYDTTKPPAPPEIELAVAVDQPIEYIPTIGGVRSLRKRTIEQLYPYRVELERYRMNFKSAGIHVSRKELRDELKSVQNEASRQQGRQSKSKSPERQQVQVHRTDYDSRRNRSQSQSPGIVAARRGGRRIIESDSDNDSVESDMNQPDQHAQSRSSRPNVSWGSNDVFALPADDSQSQSQSQSQDIFRPSKPRVDRLSSTVNNSDDGPVDSSSSVTASSDDNDDNSDDSDDDVMMLLEEYKKKVKGVLPPSFITLEYSKYVAQQKQKKKEESVREKARKRHEKEISSAQKGVARRKIGHSTSITDANANSNSFWAGAGDDDEESQPNIPNSADNDSYSGETNGYNNNMHVDDDDEGREGHVDSASDVEVQEEFDYMTSGTTRGTSANKNGSRRTSKYSSLRSSRSSKSSSRPKSRSDITRRHRDESRSLSDERGRSRRSSKNKETTSLGSLRSPGENKRKALPKNRQLSIVDMSQEVRSSQGFVPSFLSVAERSAKRRTNARPDNYNKKYISIDSRYDSEMDSGSDESVVSTVIQKWKTGKLVKRRGNAAGSTSTIRVRTAPIRKVPLVTSTRSQGHRTEKVNPKVMHPLKPVPNKVASRAAPPPPKSLEIKSRSSKDAYFSSRARQHSTAILEVPSGRYAIRRTKHLKPRENAVKKTPESIFSLLSVKYMGKLAYPPVDNTGPHTLPRVTRAKKTQNSIRKPDAEMPLSTVSKRRDKSRYINDVADHVSDHIVEDPAIDKTVSLSRSLYRFLGEQIFSVSFDIYRPPKDLWFAEDTFLGKNIVQQLLSTKSRFSEYNSLHVDVDLEGSVVSLDNIVFSSSVGLILSVIKGWEFDNNHVDSLYAIFEALSKAVMKCYAEESFDNLKELSASLLELLKMTSEKPSRVLTTTFTILLLHSIQKLLGRTSDTYSSEEYIDHLLSAGSATLEFLAVSRSDELVELVKFHRSSLNRDIFRQSYMLELLAVLSIVFDDLSYITKDPSRSIFGLMDRIAQRDMSHLSKDFSHLEWGWRLLYLICFIKELIKPILGNLKVLTWSWKAPYLMINIVTNVFSTCIQDLESGMSNKAGKYLSVVLHRCIHMIHHWGWPCDTNIVISLFYYFAKIQFNNLESLADIRIPKVILSASEVTMLRKSDSAFESFLKLVGITIWRLHDRMELRKMIARITPLNSRYYSRTSELRISDLGALCNQYSLLLMMFAHCPSEVRLSVLQLRDTSELNESHIRVRLLGVEAWKTCTIVLVRENKDIAACMDWFDSMVLNTLEEFNKLEQTSTSEDVMENERRLENQQVYCNFLEQSFQMLLEVFHHVYSLPSSSRWYQLLSKVCIRILDSHVSPTVDNICLNVIIKFIDVAQNLSKEDGVITYDINNESAVYFSKKIFDHFHRIVVNMVGSESFSSEVALKNTRKAVETEAEAAYFLVSNHQYTWNVFVLSQYSWRWLPDSHFKKILKPLWLKRLIEFGAYSCEPPLFLEFFIYCLVCQDVNYEHIYCKELLKFCDETWISPLKDFISKLSTADSFVKHRPSLIKEMMVLLSKEQLHQESLVRTYVGYFLLEVKQNYTQMKALKKEESYHNMAEFCMGLVIEHFELTNIPNLQWFKNSVNFPSSKSMTLDKFSVKRYLGMPLNDGKSYNRSRLVMFVAYSLESSLISNEGASFASSVSSALTESVSNHRESCLYIVNNIFARYVDLSTRDDCRLAEYMLPTIAKTFANFVEGRVGISKPQDYRDFFESFSSYFDRVLLSSTPNVAYMDSAYYLYAALNVMLQSSVAETVISGRPLNKEWLSILKTFMNRASRLVSVDFRIFDRDRAASAAIGQEPARRQLYSNSEPTVVAIRQALNHFKEDPSHSNSGRVMFIRGNGSIGMPTTSENTNRLVFYRKISQRQTERAILTYIKYVYEYEGKLSWELQHTREILMRSLSSPQIEWLTMKAPHIGGWHHDKTLIDGFVV